MVQRFNPPLETPSQTAGPYVQIGCTPNYAGLSGIYPEDIGGRAIEDGAKGTLITVRGFIRDGRGEARLDPMIETWQADAGGKFAGQDGADPMVNGFCRFPVNAETGEFELITVKPGPVPMRGGGFQAPNIAFWMNLQGNNIGLSTRMYFDDEDNSTDFVLSKVPQTYRRDTMIAKKTGTGEYRFDVYLQGDLETVFLDM